MKKESKSNNLFLPTFILWYVTEILFNTTLESFLGVPIKQLNNVINYLILLLLMIQIFFSQIYKRKEAIIIVTVSIPIIIAAAISSNFSLLSALMFIIASQKSDFEKIINVAYKILCIMIPLVIICYFIGIIDEYTGMRSGILRHSLGFSHPNQFGLRLFQFVACYLYRKRKRLNFYDYFFSIVIMILGYLVPNSWTACICMLVLIVLLIIYRLGERYSHLMLRIYGKALFFGAILFNGLSIIWSLMDVRDNFVLNQIDLWMSKRFSLCHKVFQMYGISLLGQRIYVSEVERKIVGIADKLYLDNGYMSILLRYGVVTYWIFSICYLYAMYYLKKRNQYFLLIILFVYALYGVMETGFYMVTHNIFLISFGNILYEKSKKKST